MRTELHFHLLPGVDDGPESDDAAVALARLAVQDGTLRVVVTPHGHALDVSELDARVAALRKVLLGEQVALELRGGCELLPADVLRLSDDELAHVAQGPAGRRWVLMEAPLEDDKPLADVVAAFDRLSALRLGVLIAHPERSPVWHREPGALERARRAGARLQVNASSLTGFHGEDARRRGVELIAAGDVAVLASDAHGVHRPPRLGEAVAMLASEGIDGARLADDGPASLLDEGLAPLRRLADAA